MAFAICGDVDHVIIVSNSCLAAVETRHSTHGKAEARMGQVDRIRIARRVRCTRGQNWFQHLVSALQLNASAYWHKPIIYPLEPEHESYCNAAGTCGRLSK